MRRRFRRGKCHELAPGSRDQDGPLPRQDRGQRTRGGEFVGGIEHEQASEVGIFQDRGIVTRGQRDVPGDRRSQNQVVEGPDRALRGNRNSSPDIHQERIGGDAARGKNRLKQRPLVLAVSIEFGKRLRRRAGLVTSDPQLHRDVAHAIPDHRGGGQDALQGARVSLGGAPPGGGRGDGRSHVSTSLRHRLVPAGHGGPIGKIRCGGDGTGRGSEIHTQLGRHLVRGRREIFLHRRREVPQVP